MAAWYEDQDAELLRLRARGLTAGQISRKFGRSRNAVLGRLFRLGHCTKSAFRPRPITDNSAHLDMMTTVISLGVRRAVAVAAFYNAGVPLADIAKRLGISRQRAHQLYQQALTQ